MQSIHDTVRVAEGVGKAVIASEHANFVNQGIDNGEHIPRALRLAQAVADSLRSLGVDEREAEGVQANLRSYARDLFLTEWRSQIYEREDVEEVMSDGEMVFDRYAANAS